MRAWGVATLSKRDSNTDVFLWNIYPPFFGGKDLFGGTVTNPWIWLLLTGASFSINILVLESPFGFNTDKKCGEQNTGVQRGNLNWRKINFLKSPMSNYGKYIIFKILKTGNSSSIKWRRRLYIDIYCLKKIMDIASVGLYWQFGTLDQSGVIFLIGNLTGVSIMIFNQDWEYEIVNQSGLQTNLSKNWCYCLKMRGL